MLSEMNQRGTHFEITEHMFVLTGNRLDTRRLITSDRRRITKSEFNFSRRELRIFERALLGKYLRKSNFNFGPIFFSFL